MLPGKGNWRLPETLWKGNRVVHRYIRLKITRQEKITVPAPVKPFADGKIFWEAPHAQKEKCCPGFA
jgi:hypothetical protein